jgi:hypothetical protein
MEISGSKHAEHAGERLGNHLIEQLLLSLPKLAKELKVTGPILIGKQAYGRMEKFPEFKRLKYRRLVSAPTVVGDNIKGNEPYSDNVGRANRLKGRFYLYAPS